MQRPQCALRFCPKSCILGPKAKIFLREASPKHSSPTGTHYSIIPAELYMHAVFWHRCRFFLSLVPLKGSPKELADCRLSGLFSDSSLSASRRNQTLALFLNTAQSTFFRFPADQNAVHSWALPSGKFGENAFPLCNCSFRNLPTPFDPNLNRAQRTLFRHASTRCLSLAHFPKALQLFLGSILP